MELTKRETEMIVEIAENEYTNGNPENPIWSFAVCGDHASAAVLGSLVKKGMAWTQDKGRDAQCGLTEAGLAEYRKMNRA